MYLEESAELINKKLAGLINKNNIVLWGMAENTVRLFQYTEISRYSIRNFVDNSKAGQFLFGKIVNLPKEINWNEIDAVVISSFYHEDEIEEELRRNYNYEGFVLKLNEEGQQVPFYEHLLRQEIQVTEDERSILDKNRIFKGIHTGKRIFILCCGPSIGEMDLTLLKDEMTMAVHSFYLHKDIEIIRPDYYCSAPWSYDERKKEDLGVKYAKEIKHYLGDAKYFFSINDRKMIQDSKAFGIDDVYFYNSGICSYLYEEIDFCQKIMSIQSVPILCIQMALYMGFKEIYLLGTEHDNLVTMKYNHFYRYEDSIISKSNGETDCNGNLNDTFGNEINCYYNLWNQYRVLKGIAERSGSKVYNATPKGVLDVFERVEYKALF